MLGVRGPDKGDWTVGDTADSPYFYHSNITQICKTTNCPVADNSRWNKNGSSRNHVMLID